MSVALELIAPTIIVGIGFALVYAMGGTRQSQIERKSATVAMQELVLALERSPVPNFTLVAALAVILGLSTYLITASMLVLIATAIAFATGVFISVYPWILGCMGLGVYVSYRVSAKYDPWENTPCKA